METTKHPNQNPEENPIVNQDENTQHIEAETTIEAATETVEEPT